MCVEKEEAWRKESMPVYGEGDEGEASKEMGGAWGSGFCSKCNEEVGNTQEWTMSSALKRMCVHLHVCVHTHIHTPHTHILKPSSKIL